MIRFRGWYDIKDPVKFLVGGFLTWWLLLTPTGFLITLLVLTATDTITDAHLGTLFIIWLAYTVVCLVIFALLHRADAPVHHYLSRMRLHLNRRGVEKNAEARHSITDLGDIHRYRNIYSGVARTYRMHHPAHFIPVMLIGGAGVAAMYFTGFGTAKLYLSIGALYLLFVLLSLNMLLTRKVTIGPQGVSLRYRRKTYLLPWDRVQTVGMTVKSDTGKPRTGIGYVFVSSDRMSDSMYCHPDKMKEIIGERLVAFKFRPKLMHHLLAYWQGEVQGLERIPAWRRYVRRYNKKYE